MRRIYRWFGLALLLLALLIGSGLLLADRLTPPATGQASHVLPLQAAQTEIDRELAPLLAAHPGQTGVLMLPDGLDGFAARAMATRKAGRSVDMQYFIWHDDLAGRLLAREVYAAGERGVRVRMLLDDMNLQGLDPQLMALDAHPSIELRLYNPFRNRTGLGRVLEMVQRIFSVNHRMHNKAWIADGRVAVLGGRNIGEEYFSASFEKNFRDLDLLLFGPAVSEASAIFDNYWNSAAAVPFSVLKDKQPEDLRRLLADTDAEADLPAAQPYLARVAQSRSVAAYAQSALTPHWTSKVHVFADPPLKWRSDDRQGWMVDRISAMLATTKHKALVISPYFVPGEFGTNGLAALAKRGAEVGVTTNSLAANDVSAVHSGYARYRGRLLEQNVHLYEIKARRTAAAAGKFGSTGASLHTKAFVVDDARGFVGSFNMDPRSTDLNTEMGVFFEDPGIAADLRKEYLRLTDPELSYWVYRNGNGDVRWLDRAQSPAVALVHEPDTGAWQRMRARVLAWLPIESQL